LRDLVVHTMEKSVSVTCSFGVSEWQLGDTIDCMLRRADVALYEAKKGGRNCVVSTSSMPDTTDYSCKNSVVRSGME
jgi:two-component system cell cycle response regulator